MRKAENGEARRIIDAAAAVAVDIDEGEIADWWGRLVAEPTIHLRAGACRQRESSALARPKFRQVVWSAATTSSGRRPTRGPGCFGAPSSTSDSSGSPTHAESSRPRIPTPWSSSLKGQCSSRPYSCPTTTAFGPLTSAATRSSRGRGRPRPPARTSACSIPSCFRTGIRGAPLGTPTRSTSSRPHRPISPRSSSTTHPLEERYAVLPRIPRFTPWSGTRRTRNWHRRFNAWAVVYGHLHIPGSTDSTACRSG